MTALLNLLPIVIFGLAFYVAFRRRSWKIAGATLIAVVLYGQLQPSYMPKGEVAKQQLPAFESRGEIKNNILKPMATEEREARLDGQLNEIDRRVRAE